MSMLCFHSMSDSINPVQKTWITMLNTGLEVENAVVFNPLCNIRTANFALT